MSALERHGTKISYPAGERSLSSVDVGPDRRKTSFEVDFAKVAAAKRLLGTTTLTATVDAAFDRIIALEQRGSLVELLFGTDDYELADADVMSRAWR